MSIPVSIDPLGTLGGDIVLMLDSFTEADIPAGITPLGKHYGRNISRKCALDIEHGVLFFGYEYQKYVPLFSYIYGSYGGATVPPRAIASACSEALEVWNLSTLRRLVVRFSASKTIDRAFATSDDWETWWECGVKQNGNEVTVDSEKPCQSLTFGRNVGASPTSINTWQMEQITIKR